ncbi:uncharacterized protein LOC113370117 isoform X2 [Ctenocephalides felis]|uniref:uncharacterized protein LOC113370117 isoform X2 n=1 Tax=Ctenocephalides felis TaxID=7515 RepID=UPI000E6E44E1|nr:uncharacterized protein LOC113370117 isoform X2 [Ctenocephalides felis]
MGNGNGKLKSKLNLLTNDEIKVVQTSFKHISKNTSKIKDDDLVRIWSTQIDPKLCKYVSNYLFGTGERKTHLTNFENFAELFVYSVRDHADEEAEVPYPLIKEYAECIVSSYVKVLKIQNSPGYHSWSAGGFSIHNECLLRFGEGLAHTIGNPRNGIRHADLFKWFNHSPTIIKMMSHIFTHVYNYIEHGSGSSQPNKSNSMTSTHSRRKSSFSSFVNLHAFNTDMLPLCSGLRIVPDYTPIIDIAQLLFISSNLPIECQREWRFLFSSRVHGNSFNTLLGRILEQGPTVLIVEDEDGHIFGGFATDSWVVGPRFFGKNTSFLFTLAPQMRIYASTSYNDHYQYLNTFQQTMPNGLGMGGQFNFWGFFLSNDYGIGQSCESCTTYKDYQQLSKSKDFKIKNLEVWAVDEEPLSAEELGERSDKKKGKSVLMGNEENKAILEMAGRQHYSDGLVEDPDCV